MRLVVGELIELKGRAFPFLVGTFSPEQEDFSVGTDHILNRPGHARPAEKVDNRLENLRREMSPNNNDIATVTMKTEFKFSNLLGTVYSQGNLLFSSDGTCLYSPVGNRCTVFDLKKYVRSRFTTI
jgi:hypothetical protein